MAIESNPESLTRKNLRHFRQLLVHGQLVQAYDELAARGYRYATLANGVVKGDSFSGRIALEFLEKTAEEVGHPLSEEALDAIRLAMASAYLDTLGLQMNGSATSVTRDILADEAWKFHAVVFQAQGLDPDAWILNLPFKLMEAEARQAYWAAMLNSAGDIAKEVLLGLATDLIIKQAAVDLFAPIVAEDAWRWLHRLHNLDTYLAAAEVTNFQLDLLATALPTMLADKMRDGLDVHTVNSMLGYVAQASIDEPLKTQLTALC